jgi:hypothetical protein
MSEPLLYREIQFSRLGGTLPEKVGSFVVGIPTKAVEEYHQKHLTDTMDATFRNLLSANEIQQMERILQILNVSDRKNYPFHGEPQSLGTPTFEDEEGEDFGGCL